MMLAQLAMCYTYSLGLKPAQVSSQLLSITFLLLVFFRTLLLDVTQDLDFWLTMLTLLATLVVVVVGVVVGVVVIVWL